MRQKMPGNNDLMKRVGDYYASAMDSVAIEKLGYRPIKPYLDAIDCTQLKGTGFKTYELPACPVHHVRLYTV